MMKKQRRGKSKNSIGQISATIFILMIITLTQIALISAADWDNKKSFDKDIGKYGRVEFRNSMLGLDWWKLGKISTLELKKNTDVCDGNNCEAIKEIVMYSKGKLIDNVRFINLDSGKEVQIKNYQIQYKRNNKWIDYSYEEVNGNKNGIVYEVRLVGELFSFQTVDWQIQSQGIWIEEWAVWDSGLNIDLVSYWNLDEVTGDALDSVGSNDGTVYQAIQNSNGKVNKAYLFDGIDDYVSVPDDISLDMTTYTISLWINQTDNGDKTFLKKGDGFNWQYSLGLINSVVHFYTRNSAGSGWSCDINGGTPTNGLWYMYTATFNSTQGEFFVNGVSKGTCANPTYLLNSEPLLFGYYPTREFKGTIDEIGIWNRALSNESIVQLYNEGNGLTYSAEETGNVWNINLISPTNASSTKEDTIEFNSNATITNANFTNATLNVYYSNGTLFDTNFTTISGEFNTTSLNISSFTIEDYVWNYYYCALNSTADTICNTSTSNLTFSWQPFKVTGTSFPINTFETTTESFQINITASPIVSSLSGYFWYNGTRYTSIINDLGSGKYYTNPNTFDIPLQESSGNKTFNWEFLFTLTDDSTANSNSSTYSHFVNRTYLTICNTTMNISYINFTLKNAENPFPLINGSFKLAWEWWLGSGDVRRDTSYEDVSETSGNWSFCMSPSDKSYNVNAHIETDASLFSQNNYFLVNANLSNVTENIDLYLINDSKATLTVFRVLDKSQIVQENVIIQIQLYDVGTDTFYTIAMAKTAFNGEDVAYLNWYDSLYKVILIQNNQVVKTIEPYRITESPQKITLDEDSTFIYNKFISMAYELFYNNVTQNFVLTFTKPSGEVDTGCLRVLKRGGNADTEICNVCETSSSATLYCHIGTSGNGTYIATFYATGSYWNFGSLMETIGGNFAETIYDLLGNDDATFYAMMFSGIVVALMFVSLPLGILGIILGMLGGAALGFQVIEWGSFLSIVIIGGLMIWFVKR